MTNKIWLEKSYPPAMPHEIDADKHVSLVAMFEQYTGMYEKNIAFINMDAQISYGELAVQAKAFAAYLQQQAGLTKGDKFAIMLPNTLQYPVALFGALMAGLTVVNVNPLYTARELQHQLKDAEVTAILLFENALPVLEAVIDETRVKQVIVTDFDDRLALVNNAFIDFSSNREDDGEPALPPCQAAEMVKFTTALSLGHTLSLRPVELSGSDLALLQYTGGTTGPSKGAMLTHRNMVANLEQLRGMMDQLYVNNEEFMVTALPLYHIFALAVNCLGLFAYGGTNLLITNPRDMPGLVKALGSYRFTVITGVNTLYNGLLHTPGFEQLDFSHLKVSLGGGMAIQRPVAERWLQVTGCQLLEGYGLSECSPMVTVSPYNQTRFSGAIGVPMPSTDIRLLDDSGAEVAIGEPGELWVKGPQVMKGYYNRQAASDEILKDGWFDTGDIASMDENGLFSIVDRKKDMIIVSGFNVYPNEIEAVMVMHDGVLEAAAIGVPNEASGEMVKVFVVRKDPKLDEQSLLAHCRQYLTAYKVPKLFEFIDELPKTNVGKILRTSLRQTYQRA